MPEPEIPGAAGYDAIRRAPAERLNLCEGNLAELAPSVTSLVLTTTFPDGAPADGSSRMGTVTLTKTDTQRVSGTTGASPAITLSQNGTVLRHGNGPTIAMAMMVDLDPGGSLEYGALFTPVRCGVEDDMAESFRENLPALKAVTYEVSAAIDIMLDVPVNGSSEFDPITGALESISLGKRASSLSWLLQYPGRAHSRRQPTIRTVSPVTTNLRNDNEGRFST